MLRPLFNRVGSKRILTEYLLTLFPQNINVYIEPFLGSGSIALNVQANKKILNDLDETLIHDFRLIKRVSNNIVNRTIPDLDVFLNKTHNTDEDKLIAAVIRRNNGFGNIPINHNNNILKYYDPMKKIKKIELYKKALENATLSNKDYREIIKDNDSGNSFFFLDPPYEKSDGLYKNSVIDYEEMYTILKNLKGKFMLTINNSKYMRDLFKNFNIKKIKITGQGNHRIGFKDRRELIITNY